MNISPLIFLLAAIAEPTDTLTQMLEEVEVTAPTKLTAVSRQPSGKLSLQASAMGNMPMFMGNADPVRYLQALPAAATNSDFSAGIYVQGCENSQNSVTIDGIPVFNPMHMLGLFSIFNTPHFQRFVIEPNGHSAISRDFIGASIEAQTPNRIPDRLHLQGSVGLVDTHLTFTTPLQREKSSLTLSGRATYVDLLFGNALKIDQSALKYGFNDWNLTYLQLLSDGWKLKLSAYAGWDHMRLPDERYAIDTNIGWHNILAGAQLSNDVWQHTLGFSTYGNRFDLNYSDIDVQLPSSIAEIGYRGVADLEHFSLAASLLGLRERKQTPVRNPDDELKVPLWGMEASLGADWKWKPSEVLMATVGMKLALYEKGNFTRLYPLPSATLRWEATPWLNVAAHFGLYAQFTHKIQESTMGMPTDFWIIASRRYKPERARSASLSLSGQLFDGVLDWSVEGYWRSMSNVVEYDGALFSLMNDGYDPMQDVVTGVGRAYGVSVMLKKNFGAVQGWVSYNYGKSEQRFAQLGEAWYPSSHDRVHDFNITLQWRINRRLTASASWVYATGFPFTEPLYGYILGENLIFEFKPRNSSRPPDYHRLDFSLDWKITTGRFEQGLNLSVFNAYARQNVLFQYIKYSPSEGVHHKQVGMKSLLPSLSYYFKF